MRQIPVVLMLGLVIFSAETLQLAMAATMGFEEADVDTERCLSEGKILKKKRNLEGVTGPEMFLIECDGKQRPVVVKQLHSEVRGVQRFADGTWEMNFTDSYLYERAAYLLDRHLGIDMVPVAVIREVKRREGAVIEWVDNASHVDKSPHEPTGPEVAALAKQKATMRIFDALIYNTDRNVQNFLVDDRDWRLYLIDHSRAFRQTTDLPEGFVENRAWLSQDLYDRLTALDRETLVEMMAGLISEGQVDKMLSRRDKIIEKIDADRAEFGDAVVFSGWSPDSLDVLLLSRLDDHDVR